MRTYFVNKKTQSSNWKNIVRCLIDFFLSYLLEVLKLLLSIDNFNFQYARTVKQINESRMIWRLRPKKSGWMKQLKRTTNEVWKEKLYDQKTEFWEYHLKHESCCYNLLVIRGNSKRSVRVRGARISAGSAGPIEGLVICHWISLANRIIRKI